MQVRAIVMVLAFLLLACLVSPVALAIEAADGTETGSLDEEGETGEGDGDEVAEMETSNQTADEIQAMVAESLLRSLMEQSGANESEASAVIDAAKNYSAGDESSVTETPELESVKEELASSLLTSLLGQMGVNETVTGVVLDYARSHANETGSLDEGAEADGGEENETVETDSSNLTGDEIQAMVAESMLRSMLEQSGANESETSAIIDAAKDQYSGNESSATETPELESVKEELASSLLTSLLGQLGANETVTTVVLDYAREHADEAGYEETETSESGY